MAIGICLLALGLVLIDPASAAKLVLQALESGKASSDELAEIRKLLKSKQGGSE